MTDYAALYRYCDFYFMKNGRPMKWRRKALADLPAAVSAAAAFNCFYSVQRYSSPDSPVAGVPEIHYAPPYADFDAEDLDVAQMDMRKLVQFAKEELDLEDSEIRVWFSGKKGFHVTFSPTAFGVVPAAALTYGYGRMFSHLAEFLSITTMDLSVYSQRRMWRIPNTVHAATNLFKRELDHDEITETVETICELAREPRRDEVVTDDEFYGALVPPARDFLARFIAEQAVHEAATAVEAGVVTLHPEAAEGDPVCVTDILGGGLKKPGDRNKATIALGGYYKDVGRPLDQAVREISKWAIDLPAPTMRQPNDAYVRANTASVLRTVYDSDNYHFGCRFIRSLHGPKTSADYERVACAGESCPFITGPLVEPSVVDVHLSRIGDPALLGKTIRTRLRVAGRQESAYLIPAKVVYRSTSDECSRAHCLLHEQGGRVERDFTAEHETRVLLGLCATNDQQMNLALRKVIERGSCKSFTYDVLSYVRVIEMTCVPKAETVVTDHDDNKRRDEAGGEFVYQRVYAVNLDFQVNNYYEVLGRVYPHPRHQEASLIITEASPTQDAIEDFDLELSKPLFDAYAGEPDEVLDALIADMAVNVTQVGGREAALMALLMTIHSPLSLQWGDNAYGGWMQTLLIGDTGAAKSQLIERLVRHIGLGELLSAQSSGRTGLLYTIITKYTSHNFIQWGAFVLNDRRLLVIDEASGIDKAGYAELRNARRDGVFKVSRSVSGEAQTRTRLIVLSNPRYGKNMSAFGNGIEAVEPLFENADIRRFDLVVGFRAGTVSAEQIADTLETEVEHKFTHDVLRANVLWAWSRRPEEIHWNPQAVARVKSESKRLNSKYEGSNIHLLSQDANEKLARMSQAVAAMLHSTDDLHITLLVLPQHVEYAAALIDSVYSSTDLDFEMYVRQNSENVDTVDYQSVWQQIYREVSLPFGVSVQEVINVFSRNRAVNAFAMESLVGDAKTSKVVAKALFKLGLIQTSVRGGGLEATPTFKELIRQHYRYTAALEPQHAG